jgi:hypothetical protein
VATYSVGSASLTVVPDMSGFSARLRADLARLRPEVKVGARLEEGDLQRIKARLRGLDTTATVRINTSGAMGGVSSLNRSLKFLALGAGGVAVAPQLVSIAGAAVQAAQSLLLLPAAASAAGASLASLLVGFSGVGKAFKGYQADQESAASTSAKSAKTEIGNAAAIRSAQEGVADARRAAARTARDGAEQVAAAEKQITAARKDAARVAEQGAQQIATAERRVTDAVDAERKAEEDVARARKDAALAAEDLRSRVQHLAVSQQEAAIRVAEAEEARAQVNRVAGATDRDRLKAELDLREARLDQADLVREAGRATTELIGIEKNGIDSTDQVQSALEKQSEAQQKVVDERADLVQTQKDVAQANQDAAAHIVEAQSAATKAQRDAAEANADASRNVTQALESLETTQAKQAAGADVAAAKTSKFSEAMAKLSPNARELVQALIAQGAAWHAVKLDVQDKLFAGLGARITQLAKVWLPALKVGLGGIAGQFNLLFKDMIGFFAQSSSVTDWSTIMANTATTGRQAAPGVHRAAEDLDRPLRGGLGVPAPAGHQPEQRHDHAAGVHLPLAGERRPGPVDRRRHHHDGPVRSGRAQRRGDPRRHVQGRPQQRRGLPGRPGAGHRPHGGVPALGRGSGQAGRGVREHPERGVGVASGPGRDRPVPGGPVRQRWHLAGAGGAVHRRRARRRALRADHARPDQHRPHSADQRHHQRGGRLRTADRRAGRGEACDARVRAGLADHDRAHHGRHRRAHPGPEPRRAGHGPHRVGRRGCRHRGHHRGARLRGVGARHCGGRVPRPEHLGGGSCRRADQGRPGRRADEPDAG